MRRLFVLQRLIRNLLVEVHHARDQSLVFGVAGHERPEIVGVSEHFVQKPEIKIVQTLASINLVF